MSRARMTRCYPIKKFRSGWSPLLTLKVFCHSVAYAVEYWFNLPFHTRFRCNSEPEPLSQEIIIFPSQSLQANSPLFFSCERGNLSATAPIFFLERIERWCITGDADRCVPSPVRHYMSFSAAVPLACTSLSSGRHAFFLQLTRQMLTLPTFWLTWVTVCLLYSPLTRPWLMDMKFP